MLTTAEQPETIDTTKQAFQRDGVTIYLGDCRETLKNIPNNSVHCCVTSPPYFGLRDYGCDGQIGLEATPAEFVAQMVAVFREVRRTLRDDGVLWLNLGDSYASQPSWGRGGGSTLDGRKQGSEGGKSADRTKLPGLKPKDLIGIPWMVAFALRADGWFLRQDIIWHKPNPMPESVTDRCTKSHEYIFLLSKSERYHFDSDAIKEQSVRPEGSGNKERKQASSRGVPVDTNGSTNGAVADSVPWQGETRNKRSVWTVSTKPYKGAHFAVFPSELIEPCILAGCPEGGTVLDPFTGSGTTAEVAKKNGCNFVGCELNPEYLELAVNRFKQRTLALK